MHSQQHSGRAPANSERMATDIKDNDKEMTDGGKNRFVREVADKKYEFGFTTDVHTEIITNERNCSYWL